MGDKEIVAQEERVQEARDRLASAIKALSWDFFLSSTYLCNLLSRLSLEPLQVAVLSSRYLCNQSPLLRFYMAYLLNSWVILICFDHQGFLLITFYLAHRGFLTLMKDICEKSLGVHKIIPAMPSHSCFHRPCPVMHCFFWHHDIGSQMNKSNLNCRLIS